MLRQMWRLAFRRLLRSASCTPPGLSAVLVSVRPHGSRGSRRTHFLPFPAPRCGRGEDRGFLAETTGAKEEAEAKAAAAESRATLAEERANEEAEANVAAAEKRLQKFPKGRL